MPKNTRLALIGSYEATFGPIHEVLTFRADGSGHSKHCNARFQYRFLSPVEVMVTIEETNGNWGCFRVGKLLCKFRLWEKYLAYDCGIGNSAVFTHITH